MEADEYCHGSCYRAGTQQFAMEKQGKARGDQFVVEDLLDLSKQEDDDTGMHDREDGVTGAQQGIPSTESSSVTAVDSCSNSGNGGHENYYSVEIGCRSLCDAGLSGDLCEPYEELAELEWLSNFVEESFSSEDVHKLQLISGFKATSTSASQGEDSSSASAAGGSTVSDGQPPFFEPEAPVPGKARSKRSRVAPCNWSSRLLMLSSSSTTLSTDSVTALIPACPSKKAAKKVPSLAASDGRKCLHCATDKTPQWRTGPMGPKTLCNACGVRYKSGRLVPEYRPAASPTFVLSKHSNSHRKVLDLRRQKELQQQQQFLHGGGVAIPCLYEGAASATAAVATVDDFLIHSHHGADFRQLI